MAEVSDEITSKVFLCEASGKPFRVLRQELEFYRKMNLPLPYKSPDVRHQERLQRRNPHLIFARTSSQSGVEIYSSFAGCRPEKVCSEEEF